ncbi:hypothetical protein FLACOL7796_00899 [Flavobacterium collinsii]|uniref:Lipoprotein n=2 Tax=Flavobacterium collinsii TaxID=1114861 RepID=A0A9W4TFW0_9FLAO|nr:hypothetical protein FLACOL7796_00899 [Flavobacterium collinsii]CAI2766280.1 conserved protein of unknown function [Flavobacterium collinsii]
MPQIHCDMKKIVSLVLLLFIVSSCSEDVKFNNPAFQSLKENVFWRATTYKATSGANGSFVIEGDLGFEKVVLKVSGSTAQTYILGRDNSTTATYLNMQDSKSSRFSTGTNKGDGQIVITEFNAENRTISGTFKFNAWNEDEKDTEKPKVSFTEGVFYKIPISTTFEN